MRIYLHLTAPLPILPAYSAVPRFAVLFTRLAYILDAAVSRSEFRRIFDTCEAVGLESAQISHASHRPAVLGALKYRREFLRFSEV